MCVHICFVEIYNTLYASLGFISYFGIYKLFWSLSSLQVITDFIRHFAKMGLQNDANKLIL